MSDHNKVKLYSYKKVWKISYKIYSIANINLPVPVDPYDLLYFFGAAGFILILGNIFPVLKNIPPVLSYVALPYGVMKFLTKKKLDGKNPIKYFVGYLYHIFVERNTYIERFKTYPYKREERLKLRWFCSMGYSKRPVWDYIRIVNERRKKRAGAPKRSTGSKKKKKKKKPVNEQPKQPKKVKISSGPRVRAQVEIKKPKIEEPMSRSERLELKFYKTLRKLRKIWREIVTWYKDPETQAAIKKLKEKIYAVLRFILKTLRKPQIGNSDHKKAAGLSPANKSKNQVKKKTKARPHKDIPILDDITLVISVCSLVPGAGSTHTAKALAYYIKHELKKEVCIIDVKGKNSNHELNGIEVYRREEIIELYDRYKFIILDVGCYDPSVRRDIKQSQIKIMCALLEDSYLKKLAHFVKEEEGSKKWKYIFNHVPPNKQKNVSDLMEIYDHWCMPVNDAMSFDEDTEKAFYRILKGERL